MYFTVIKYNFHAGPVTTTLNKEHIILHFHKGTNREGARYWLPHILNNEGEVGIIFNELTAEQSQPTHSWIPTAASLGHQFHCLSTANEILYLVGPSAKTLTKH